LSIAPVTE